MAAMDNKIVLRLAIFHLLALSHMMDTKLAGTKSTVTHTTSRTMRLAVSPESTTQLPSTTFAPSSSTAQKPSTTQAPSTSLAQSPSTTTPLVGTSTQSIPHEVTTKAGQKTDAPDAFSHVSSIPEEITTKHLERRIPSRLEEKLESLSCDILPLPSESRLWKGNETQELMLPIMVPPDCDANENEENDCDPNKASSASWAGTAEMQSGDILLVRIDEERLVKLASKMPAHSKQNLPVDERRQPETAVYQVTRPGHAHCDVTEGVLLDITPLEVDGRKIVTLYDKDLTEGVNLLIVVSAKWGGQCVRLRVVVKSDTCGDNQECSTKGVCFSNVSMEGYECQCCPGYVGPHCEEKDACFPSPCKNNGICVDISQGHDGNIFQCLCPYVRISIGTGWPRCCTPLNTKTNCQKSCPTTRFTGKTCEEETNPCDSSPCLNGGSCFRNVTTRQFRCDCEPGFAGALCQHSQECESSPCVHGICVNEDDGYRCFCQPGFAGQQCEYEYNECESSPCINGGTCMDHIDGYTCICGRGFTAKRCHVKIDLCDPNPCHNHHYCVDRGNNYSCECPKGFSGPDCLIPSRAACSVNPCHHGGTCWSSVQSFYCACKPGYTGKTCQDEFVLETMPSAYPDNGADNEVDAQIPVSVHLDHLHNLYVAAGTLACAVTIVMLTVAACHCRVHETYKRCFLNATPLLPCKVTRLEEIPSPSSTRLCHPPIDKSSNGQAEHRSFPAMDNSEMYYTLDFSDSQSSPLIQ